MEHSESFDFPAKYSGIVLNGMELSLDSRIDDMIFYCGEAAQDRLAPAHSAGSFGNLSYRIMPGHPHCVCTRSQLDLNGELSQEDFVGVSHVDRDNIVHVYSMDGKVPRKPTSEINIHFRGYLARDDVGAQIHGHCDPILELSEELGIPVTRREEDYGEVALADRLVEILRPDEDFYILRNHGFWSLGKDLRDAYEKAGIVLRECQDFLTKPRFYYRFP